MTHIADIPRVSTATHWDNVRERINDIVAPEPSTSRRALDAFEALTTTVLARLLWVLGVAVVAMAMHHLATFGLPFGGRNG